MIKIDFLKKKKVFKKNNIQPDPNIYWMGVFYMSLALIFLAFIFGFYLFVKINREESPLPFDGDERLMKISKDRIERSLQVFREREDASNTIINSPAPVVDPSL